MSGGESRELVVQLAALEEWPRHVGFLSEDERNRAEEIRGETLRARFVVSRGLRRTLLAECTGRPMRELRFVEDEGSKPRMADPSGWDFNVSHSSDHVAVAVARGAVGIDLEKMRPVREMSSLVRRYFHPDESAAWEASDDSRRNEAFFVLWSAREAAMKCAGIGLARGMTKTRVDPVILSEGRGGGQSGGMRVQLRRLDAPAACVMVVARG